MLTPEEAITLSDRAIFIAPWSSPTDELNRND